MSDGSPKNKVLLEGWMGGVSYFHFWTVFNFENPRYVINYFTMVTIQRKPRILSTRPE